MSNLWSRLTLKGRFLDAPQHKAHILGSTKMRLGAPVNKDLNTLCPDVITKAQANLSDLASSSVSHNKTSTYLALVASLALGALSFSTQAHAEADSLSSSDEASYPIGGSRILMESPNLQYERNLLTLHEDLVKNYTENYVDEAKSHAKQPANKTEKCLLSSEQLEGIVQNNSLVFWEGSCKDGKADGFGRAYVVGGGRMIFEMLTNFHAEEPIYTTTYYTKNSVVESRTTYFYGKSTRIQSSGVFITKSKVENDLIVGMMMYDKTNLITYQKEISQKSKYVLNSKDYGNYIHFIHDLQNTNYRSLYMSYRLADRTNGNKVGYNFTGLSSGQIKGTYTDEQGKDRSELIPRDVISHVIEINDEVNVNVEDSIKSVIAALPVVEAYMNVVCDASYQNPLCKKMSCKKICDLKETITPNDPEVKKLLLALVDHHNNRPLYTYLNNALREADILAEQERNRTKNALAGKNQQTFDKSWQNKSSLEDSRTVSEAYAAARAEHESGANDASADFAASLHAAGNTASSGYDEDATSRAANMNRNRANSRSKVDLYSSLGDLGDEATGNEQHTNAKPQPIDRNTADNAAIGSFNNNLSRYNQSASDNLYRAKGPSLAPQSYDGSEEIEQDLPHELNVARQTRSDIADKRQRRAEGNRHVGQLSRDIEDKLERDSLHSEFELPPPPPPKDDEAEQGQ